MSRPNPSLDRRQLLTAAGLGAAVVPLAAGAASAAETAASSPSASAGSASATTGLVQTGAQRLAATAYRQLAGRKVGVVTNPTGILPNLRSIVDEMYEHGGVDIVGVFGPEHGFRGTAQAGGSEGTFIDPRTGLTVYDAYGATAASLAAMFEDAGVDTVVFDIQDVGARFYTYIWTMYTAMQAAVAVGASMVVLDRPNPVGGRCRGPMMTAAWTSGVGVKEIVQQHGMTVGELARFFDGEFLRADAGAVLGKALEVVKVTGWRRSMLFDRTGLPWVPPSPNVPTATTSLLYPGTCLFEGTNLSEGRGTTKPFELIGAPYVDERWAALLTERDLPGIDVREAYFIPTSSKNEGEVCGGVQIHVTDPSRVDPVALGVEMLVSLKALYPEFAWRYDDYDPERPYWIDKLTGSPRLRTQVDAGAPVETVTGAWRTELRDFDRRRQPYLMYR